jgi:hypothetical protein
MRQVREILRMKHEAELPVREIVRRTGIPRRTGRELMNHGLRAVAFVRNSRHWGRQQANSYGLRRDGLASGP